LIFNEYKSEDAFIVADGERAECEEVEVLFYRDFFDTLCQLLSESKLGKSEIEDKANFFFGLYNMKDEVILSRDDVYNIICEYHTGRDVKFLVFFKALFESSKLENGIISADEFLTTMERDGQIIEYFRSDYREQFVS